MDGDTQLEWLFPVPLFRTELNGFEQYRDPLLALAKDLERQGPGVRHSNIGGWHSEELKDNYAEQPLAWVGEQILNCTAAGLQQSRGIDAPIDIKLASSWFMINRRYHWNSPHTHMPAQWSGVLYIAVDKSNAGKDGGRIMFIDPIPLGPAYRNPINAAYEPLEGLMLIFPSYLTHMVEPHYSEHERVCISFNFHVTMRNQTS